MRGAARKHNSGLCRAVLVLPSPLANGTTIANTVTITGLVFFPFSFGSLGSPRYLRFRALGRGVPGLRAVLGFIAFEGDIVGC